MLGCTQEILNQQHEIRCEEKYFCRTLKDVAPCHALVNRSKKKKMRLHLAVLGYHLLAPPRHELWTRTTPHLALWFVLKSKFSPFPVHVHPALQPGLSVPILLVCVPQNVRCCHSSDPCSGSRLAEEGPSGLCDWSVLTEFVISVNKPNMR